jgi:hypothetical protein
VLDSKKHVLLPLPLDFLTLQFIKELIGERKEGYVFVHEGSFTTVKAGMPLSRVQVYRVFHETALEVGVRKFSPLTMRQLFAYEWYRRMRDDGKSKKTMKGLSREMRHFDQKSTDRYLNKFYSVEDLQIEFDDDEGSLSDPETAPRGFKVGNANNSRSPRGNLGTPLGVAGETICNDCSNIAFCKYAPLPKYVESCHFKTIQKETKKW